MLKLFLIDIGEFIEFIKAVMLFIFIALSIYVLIDAVGLMILSMCGLPHHIIVTASYLFGWGFICGVYFIGCTVAAGFGLAILPVKAEELLLKYSKGVREMNNKPKIAKSKMEEYKMLIDFDVNNDETIACKIKSGWMDAGKTGKYLGKINIGDASWAIVLWDTDEDPSFHKVDGLLIAETRWKPLLIKLNIKE